MSTAPKTTSRLRSGLLREPLELAQRDALDADVDLAAAGQADRAGLLV